MLLSQYIHGLMFYRFITLLTILFVATNAFAQQSGSLAARFTQGNSFEQISYFTSIPEQISVLFNTSSKGAIESALQGRDVRRGKYDNDFYHGLHLIYANSFAEAGKVFSALWRDAHADGYRNLTSYSYVLLDMARRYEMQGLMGEVSFLTKAAMEMSPEDGRVHFAALPFAGGENTDSFWSYFSHGVSLLARYPSVVFPFMSNVLLVGLTCLTLALALTAIVQFSLYHRHIYRVLFRRIPRAFQIWIAPSILILLLGGSLFAGILPALIVWSLVLSLSLSHARWLAVVACVITISWGLGIAVIAVTNENSQLRLNHAIENIASGNFVAEDARLLRDSVGVFAFDPYVVFANGVVLYAEDNLIEAKRYFLAVLKIAAEKKSLSAAAIGNIAVIEYRLGNLAEAKQQFARAKELGASQFELLRNSSLLSLAEADTPSHRKQYDELKSDFGQQLRSLEAREGEATQPLLFLVPAMSFLKSFFRPPLDDASREHIATRQDRLASVLLINGSPVKLVLIGFVALCCVVPLALREKLQRFLGLYGTIEDKRKKSMLWLPIPGGVWLSGKFPLSGMMVLAAVLLLLMLHSAVPIPLFTIFPFPLDMGNALPVCAMLLFVVVAFCSIFSEIKLRSVG